MVSLLKHIDEIQGTFLTLLADPKSNQFVRESCCLGLAACRGLLTRKPDAEDSSDASPTEELNFKLLRAFGQTTNFGGSALMETAVQAAARRGADGLVQGEPATEVTSSEVGGAAGIGAAALGAYREMAAACVSIGRHDVLYALLLLSVSHSFWFSNEAKHLYRYDKKSLYCRTVI